MDINGVMEKNELLLSWFRFRKVFMAQIYIKECFSFGMWWKLIRDISVFQILDRKMFGNQENNLQLAWAPNIML